VGEVRDTVIEGLSIDEAHGFLVTDLPEDALAGSEYDRVDLQPQLVPPGAQASAWNR
jgi:hypothetical protein